MTSSVELQAGNECPTGECGHVGAVIVLYYPDLGLLNRLLKSLEGQVSDVFVIDNTPGSSSEFSSVFAKYLPRIKYIPLGENRGIAEAQNIAIRHSREIGCSHVLLLDQDSALSTGMVAELLRTEKLLTSQGVYVAAVGPVFVDEKTGEKAEAIRHGYLWVRKIKIERTSNDPIRTDYLIASGSLIRICVLDFVGEMNGDLFIDSVDIEWGMRALRKGYVSYMTPRAVMKHSVGDTSVRILGKQINLHSDIRHYYIVRNSAFLLCSGALGAKWRGVTLLRIPKYLIVYSLWSKRRWATLKLLLRGVLDGFRGRMGRMV